LAEETEEEQIDEERRKLWQAEERIIKIMQDAISDGILTKAERAEIDGAMKELQQIVEGDGVITESEKIVIAKIERTFNMILKIEKDFISTYWKTKQKKPK
jgi:uncharacterized protein YPO0396